jgi:hypothetical protein
MKMGNGTTTFFVLQSCRPPTLLSSMAPLPLKLHPAGIPVARRKVASTRTLADVFLVAAIKFICDGCFRSILLTRHVEVSASFPAKDAVACTLGCYKKAVKEGASDPSRLSWDNDTADGSFAMSSEATLLDWLKTPGNYQTWRGNQRSWDYKACDPTRNRKFDKC